MASKCNNLCYILVAFFALNYSQALAPRKQTGYDDLYDCVSFYKQPALDHPLLKNHSFHEMRPALKPKNMASNDQLLPNMKKAKFGSLGWKNGGCPQGMIPLRRSFNPNSIPTPPNTYLAVLQSKGEKVYYGVAAKISVFNPHIAEDPQYSSGEVSIQRGSDSLTAGWTVNPHVYKDNKTHFFVSTTFGGKTCYNGECGFISVRKDLPPGDTIDPVSQKGGTIYLMSIVIYKDKNNGNWWLHVENNTIGFWPPEIFKDGLADTGNYVSCGGRVFFPDHPGAVGPEMGSGVKPYYKPAYNAFCKDFEVVNDKNELVKIDDTERYANKPDSYEVWDGNTKDGYHILFGGPHTV